jgi:hypothetical protein
MSSYAEAAGGQSNLAHATRAAGAAAAAAAALLQRAQIRNCIRNHAPCWKHDGVLNHTNACYCARPHTPIVHTQCEPGQKMEIAFWVTSKSPSEGRIRQPWVSPPSLSLPPPLPPSSTSSSFSYIQPQKSALNCNRLRSRVPGPIHSLLSIPELTCVCTCDTNRYRCGQVQSQWKVARP